MHSSPATLAGVDHLSTIRVSIRASWAYYLVDRVVVARLRHRLPPSAARARRRTSSGDLLVEALPPKCSLRSTESF
jgi:hypothetical protein